ncbi:hypothetical protein K2O51_31680 (plasmid) [Cupriavidus pinatubonensis]|nr:hypothetical protein K2O51_31680 [Cupriavidus pinatubonensis]
MKALVGVADGALLLAGLQALWRERVAARNAAVSVASMRGTDQPAEEIFGIEEVASLLRRAGAGPSSI